MNYLIFYGEEKHEKKANVGVIKRTVVRNKAKPVMENILCSFSTTSLTALAAPFGSSFSRRVLSSSSLSVFAGNFYGFRLNSRFNEVKILNTFCSWSNCLLGEEVFQTLPMTKNPGKNNTAITITISSQLCGTLANTLSSINIYLGVRSFIPGLDFLYCKNDKCLVLDQHI